MRICDLKLKEVINECTCRKLGFVSDVEFDPKCGQICAVVVPEGCRGISFFSKEREFVIPYNCIRHIGEDIVLVEIDEKACFKG